MIDKIASRNGYYFFFSNFCHLCHCNISHLSDIFSVMYLHPVGIQIVSNFTVLTVNVAVVKIDRYLNSCQFLFVLCRNL